VIKNFDHGQKPEAKNFGLLILKMSCVVAVDSGVDLNYQKAL
jgi:hypothetical protein